MFHEEWINESESRKISLEPVVEEKGTANTEID